MWQPSGDQKEWAPVGVTVLLCSEKVFQRVKTLLSSETFFLRSFLHISFQQFDLSELGADLRELTSAPEVQPADREARQQVGVSLGPDPELVGVDVTAVTPCLGPEGFPLSETRIIIPQTSSVMWRVTGV